MLVLSGSVIKRKQRYITKRGAMQEKQAKTKTTLVTLQQAAAEYGPPYTSLRDLVIEGHLPKVQLGDSRRIWVRRADLERLVGAKV
jgi:hypothetical protein